MRKLWKILGDWIPPVVKASDYDDLLTEYDAKATEYEELRQKYMKLSGQTRAVSAESRQHFNRAVVAEQETRNAEARYKKLWRTIFFVVAVIGLAAGILALGVKVNLAREGKTLRTQVFHQEAGNTKHSIDASYPDALMKASCLNPKSGEYVEIPGDTVMLEQHRDYRIDIYVFYDAYQEFGNDIKIALPAVAHKWEHELTQLEMVFADGERLPLSYLQLVATDDVVQINKNNLNAELVATIANDLGAVDEYLEGEGFTTPYGYLCERENLYHYWFYFSTESPDYSYTYTTFCGSLMTEIAFALTIAGLVVMLVGLVGKAIYDTYKSHRVKDDENDDDDDYSGDDQDEGEPKLDLIPCNREEVSQ